MGSAYQTKRKLEVDQIWLLGLVKEAQDTKFYGQLIVIFEDGKVKRVRKETSLLPPQGR